jgi:hypothetical protein
MGVYAVIAEWPLTAQFKYLSTEAEMKKTSMLRIPILIGTAALLVSLVGCASTSSGPETSQADAAQAVMQEQTGHQAAAAGSAVIPAAPGAEHATHGAAASAKPTASAPPAAGDAAAHHPAPQGSPDKAAADSSKPAMAGMTMPDNSMMMANMEEMKALMARIKATKDPAERKRLMSAHHAKMEKHMMMMKDMDMKMMKMMKDGKCPMMQMMAAGKDSGGMMDMMSMCSQMMQNKAAMSHGMMEQMLDAQEQLLKMIK